MLQNDGQPGWLYPVQGRATETTRKTSCQKITMLARTGGLGPVWFLTWVVAVSLSGSMGLCKRPAAAAEKSGSSKHSRAEAKLPPLRDAQAEKEHLTVSQKTDPSTAPLVFEGKNYLPVGRGSFWSASSLSFSATLFLEHAGAQEQFGSLATRAPTHAERMRENRAQYFVIWGRFSKLLVLTLAKPASKTEVAAFFRSGMPTVFADRASAELRKDAETLLRLLERDVAQGTEMRLHIGEHGQINVFVDGQKTTGPQNLLLARHLLEVWLGYHAPARSLRNVLVDKIDTLKTPIQTGK